MKIKETNANVLPEVAPAIAERKSIRCYRVKFSVPDEYWRNKACIVVAENESKAIDIAMQREDILSGDVEYMREAEQIYLYSSDTKLESNTYPYGGRLKCTAYFSVEFTKNGFREVFQTINPKTGVLNKPKKSTYSTILLPCEDSKEHFLTLGSGDFNSLYSLNKAIQFMSDFYELFTEKQIESIALRMIAFTKANIISEVRYNGVDFEAARKYIDFPVRNLVDIVKYKSNLFEASLIDFKAIKQLKTNSK